MIIVFRTPGPLHRLAFHCLNNSFVLWNVIREKVHLQNVSFHNVFWGTACQVLEHSGKPSGERSLPSELMLKGKGEISFLMKIGWYLYGISWPYIFWSFLIPRCVLAQFIYILPRSGQRTDLLLRENCTQCVSVLVAQLYLTLCDPMDCSLPGPSVHGILQARILERKSESERSLSRVQLFVIPWTV